MGLHNDEYKTLEIMLTGSNNRTLKGVLNFTAMDLGGYSEEDEVYDGTGAATFVIVVILVYGLSIVLMIGSLAKKNMKLKDIDLEEKQIHRYLSQANDLREKGAKENYRQLKRTIITLVNNIPEGGTENKKKDTASVSSNILRSMVAVGSPVVAGLADQRRNGDKEGQRSSNPPPGVARSDSESLQALLEEDEDVIDDVQTSPGSEQSGGQRRQCIVSQQDEQSPKTTLLKATSSSPRFVCRQLDDLSRSPSTVSKAPPKVVVSSLQEAGKRHNLQEAGNRHNLQEAGKRHNLQEAGKRHNLQEAGNRHNLQEAGKRHNLQEAGNRHNLQEAGNRHNIQEAGKRHNLQEAGNRHNLQEAGNRHRPSNTTVISENLLSPLEKDNKIIYKMDDRLSHEGSKSCKLSMDADGNIWILQASPELERRTTDRLTPSPALPSPKSLGYESLSDSRTPSPNVFAMLSPPSSASVSALSPMASPKGSPRTRKDEQHCSRLGVSPQRDGPRSLVESTTPHSPSLCCEHKHNLMLTASANLLPSGRKSPYHEQQDPDISEQLTRSNHGTIRNDVITNLVAPVVLPASGTVGTDDVQLVHITTV